MVGTPCQILAATKLNNYADLTGGSPIDFKIGLFCMENFSYEYLKKFLYNNGINISDVINSRIDKGKFKFYLKDGEIFSTSLANAQSFTRKNCNICTDFSSDFSDISIGSVGSPEGYSTVIIRTEKGKEIFEGAEKQGFLVSEDLNDKEKSILSNISTKKIKENTAEIIKRESVAHPVIYKRNVSEGEFLDLAKECQFDNLNSDVIKEGACVLCGACEFVCPTDLIEINEKKPVKNGKCEEGCNSCYITCPRTYMDDKFTGLSSSINNPLGKYIYIKKAKTDSNAIIGQDGGVVSAILVYLLENNIMDKAFVVMESENKPNKPVPQLADNILDVLKATGTKYSVAPIAFKALKKIK
ncbi:MAG: Coenzyme F420 hydrogenase/dehydrogenase, beta subunit C-terminal domain [Methanobacteriaceae archaeon]